MSAPDAVVPLNADSSSPTPVDDGDEAFPGTAAWTALDVRSEIERLLTRDLLGPWAGDDEELPAGTIPSERYILGVLSPAGAELVPEQTDASEPDDGSGEGAGEVTAAAAAGSMAPASLGLSFSIPQGTTSLRINAAWGRYVQGPSAIQMTEAGIPRLVWKRVAAGGQGALDVSVANPSITLDAAQPDVNLRARCRDHNGVRVVDVALVNSQPEPPDRKDAAKLFQARIEVTAEDGAAQVFLPHNDPAHAVAGDTDDPTLEAAPNDDLELRSLAMLYRHATQFSVGRNAAVVAERREGEERAWRVGTSNMPGFDVAQTVAPTAEGVPDLKGLQVDMRFLATAPRDDVVTSLLPLCDGYGRWLDKRETEITSDRSVAGHERAARYNIEKGREAVQRIQAGIDLIEDPHNDTAWQAWRFANLAMALQREHTEIAIERDKDPSLTLSGAERLVDNPARRSWRPFQLAFILLNLPSLTIPGHADRGPAADDEGLADLLFFPTGGGKTEAYLGLIAYLFAVRRLQGVVDGRDGGAGVAVIMRYTLRLLTAQQFQRAATLVCAAEKLRRDAATASRQPGGAPNPWGDEPFRVGLWVGSKVTPNWYDQAKKALDDMRAKYAGAGAANPIQVLACPWCGRTIEPGQDAEPDDKRRRVIVWCGDPDGLCEFSRKKSDAWKEGIPVVTIDEEVFRLAPALVIGTVDKFAQLPLRGQTGLLFGLTRSKCERHGYRHPDMTDKTKCGDGGHNRPVTKPQPCGLLRPPDLIIQDELHLISGALGTMVGLYETAVDRLASWTVDGKQVRPKVVASTATVRRAASQTLGVFDRQLAIFPPPVLDAGDTFFSLQVPVDGAHPGRRYLGVCAHGQRLKQVQIRVAQLLLAAAQLMFDEHGMAADPYMTLVDYFSSVNELAGMRRLVDDDIATRLQVQSRRGLRDRRNLELRELTGRINTQQIGRALVLLGRSFHPDIDTTAARRHLGLLFEDARKGKGTTPEAKAARAELDALPRHPLGQKPIDVLLATSMLQVGVDVSRLGLMVVTGQPKNSAEYIQATSRVGRDADRPGLVVTIYNWARPRDLAHFETFNYFHETFYARVEPLSVTPFADRALDRGLVAVLVAVVRHAHEKWERETGAHDVPVSDAAIDAAVEWIASRAGDVVGDAEYGGPVRDKCRELMDEWDRRRRGIETGALSYTLDKDNLDPLLDDGLGGWGTWSAAWSLREVEAETNLLINLEAPEIADRPGWTWGPGPAPDPGLAEIDETDETEPADEAGLLDNIVIGAAAGEPDR